MEGGWAPVFSRFFNNWEMEEVERFLCLLHNRKIRPSQEDNLLMKDSKKAGFSIRLMYNPLDHSPPLAFPSFALLFKWNWRFAIDGGTSLENCD